MASPMERTLKYLRKQGYLCESVEKWIPVANIRRDLFGFADVIAIDDAKPHLLVQTTDITSISKRLKKAMALPALLRWLRSNGAFEVHGWRPRDGSLTPERRVVTLEDLPMGDLPPVPKKLLRVKKFGKVRGRREPMLWDLGGKKNVG